VTRGERAGKIKGIMEKQDMTMARLSRKTTLHVNTIRKALGGRENMTVDTLQEIARGIETDPAELI